MMCPPLWILFPPGNNVARVDYPMEDDIPSDLDYEADDDDDEQAAPAHPPGRRQIEPTWAWAKCRGLHVPKQIDFTARERILVELPNEPNEWDFLNLYLTDTIIELVVRETNRYAEQFITENEANLKEHSNVKSWEKTTVNEIKTYLAMLVLMGIVYKARTPMYWSTDTILETPIFAKIMQRNRFQLLTKFIHFADNDRFDPNDPNRDRLYKIKEVCDLFRQQWKTVYSPGRYLSVDESLVLFKGRLAFKQYIRTKRSRFGIKFYTLSTDKGITLDNIIYCGKLEDDLDPEEGYLTTERIPITLLKDYLQKGRVVYLDNFYMTPKLAQFLLDHGTYSVGTVRPNRKNFPKQLSAETIPKGESLFYKCNDIMAVKYRSHKDKSTGKPKVVHLISTRHRNEAADTGKKTKEEEAIIKPLCVLDYNAHMGGVDKVDQQLHQIQALRKSYKWYKKIFLRLLLQSMLNSHKLHHQHTGVQQDFLGYLHKVITIMLASTPKLVQNPRVVPRDSLFRLTGHRHFPDRRPLPETSKRQKAKYYVKGCRVCQAKGLKGVKKTPWICKNCPGQPGLHIEDCFETFHTKLDLSK